MWSMDLEDGLDQAGVGEKRIHLGGDGGVAIGMALAPVLGARIIKLEGNVDESRGKWNVISDSICE